MVSEYKIYKDLLGRLRRNVREDRREMHSFAEPIRKYRYTRAFLFIQWKNKYEVYAERTPFFPSN